MGKVDILAGGIMLALCLFAFSRALRFPGRESVVGGFGPAFFPMLVIAGMTILGVVVLIRGVMTRTESSGIDLNLKDLRTPALLLCMVVAYVVMMGLVGYFVATPLFLIGAMFIWRISWAKAILVGLGLTFVLYIFFNRILRIPIPTGIILGG